MLNTITQEIIKVANGDMHASAIAAVVCYALIALLFFGTIAITHFVYLGCLRRPYTTFIASIIQTIGCLLYFHGDNSISLLNLYGNEVGCGSSCQINNRIAATFTLGLALIIFQFVPSLLEEIFSLAKSKDGGKKRKKNPWYSLIDMISMFVKIDVLYSNVVATTDTPEFCSLSDISMSVSFAVVCLIAGYIAEIIYYISALHAKKDAKKDGDKVFRTLATFVLIVAMICFPLYFLAENKQPLDCAFGCDSFAANSTIEGLMCNRIANSATRIGFTSFTFVSITALSLTIFSCSVEKRDSSFPV